MATIAEALLIARHRRGVLTPARVLAVGLGLSKPVIYFEVIDEQAFILRVVHGHFD